MKMHKILLPSFLLFMAVSGCSGTTHPYGKITLFEIPLDQAGNASKKGNVKPSEKSDYFPKKLGNLSLFKVILNKESTGIIHELPGKKIDDCENFIAYYGRSDSKNILFASVFENAEKAETILTKMAMKVADGSSFFSPLAQIKTRDNTYFKTDGMGLEHYFYRVDNILICFQVEPDEATAAFRDLLEFDVTALNRKVDRQ